MWVLHQAHRIEAEEVKTCITVRLEISNMYMKFAQQDGVYYLGMY